MTARLDKRGEARVVELIGADATPAIARKEAAIMHKQAPNQFGDRQDEMRHDAELVEAWASREEERERALQAELDGVRGDDDAGDTSDASSSSTSDASSSKPKARAGASRSRKRVAPKSRAAASRAASGGDNALAGGIDSASGLFWRIVTMTLLVVLVGSLLRNGDRTAALLRGAGYWTTRLVYPKGAFGPYADQIHNRSQGAPLQGPPAPRRTP